MTVFRFCIVVFYLIYSTLLFNTSHAIAAAKNKKPNILVIWGDDIGQFNASAYNQGMMGYKTPNIDRIAKEGALSPTGMVSRAAPPAALRSSPGNRPFAPVSPR